MKKSDYQYFCIQDFLEDNLHDQMVLPENQCQDIGILFDKDGNTITDSNNLIIKNRYENNSYVEQFLPPAFNAVVQQLKDQLIKQGLKNPIVYNIKIMVNPTRDPMSAGYGWHKDYNPITHITDPKKLWITFLTLTPNVTDARFIVSPTEEGVGLWNIGVDLTLESNLAIGHNMNLGHHYVINDKNDLSLIYIRWYDAS